ncbi:VanZ family protein [Candidatus Bipolaricaulota sp. J31]
MLVKLILLVLHMSLLAWMSLGTGYPGPIASLFRKVSSLVLHVIGYFLLAVLLSWAFMAKGKRAVFLAFPTAFLYGLALEVAQIYVPTRGFSGVDILLNLVGSCAGALSSLIFLS